MHPILAPGGRLAPYLLAWLPLGALLAGVFRLVGQSPWAEAMVLSWPLTLVLAFLCLAAWYPCRATPLRTAGLPRLFLTHALAALLTSSLWLAVGHAWARALGDLGAFSGAGARFRELAPVLFGFGVLLYLLAVALHYLLAAFEASRRAEARALELRVLAREAELKALRAQIDPHFLFNSLNSIASLAGRDPAGARRMALLLADFLRQSLRLGAEDRIPLSEELALAGLYLEIEGVRFGDRLAVEKEIAAEVEHCLVPPFVLQPLIENAVHHGIAHLLEGGTVRIAVRPVGDRVRIAVENPRDPAAPRARKGGIGLANLRRRLAALYDGEAALSIEEQPESYRAEVTLPCRAVHQRSAP